jgi:hypothetical protein
VSQERARQAILVKIILFSPISVKHILEGFDEPQLRSKRTDAQLDGQATNRLGFQGRHKRKS